MDPISNQLVARFQHHFPTAGANRLTKWELFSLLIVSGTKRGYDVQLEFPQVVHDGRTGRLDCVWRSRGPTGTTIVGWEVDGLNVGQNHLHGVPGGRIGNLAKFIALEATIKVQALYSIRNGMLPETHYAEQFFQNNLPEVRVLTDSELIQGGMDQILDCAPHV